MAGIQPVPAGGHCGAPLACAGGVSNVVSLEIVAPAIRDWDRSPGLNLKTPTEAIHPCL